MGSPRVVVLDDNSSLPVVVLDDTPVKKGDPQRALHSRIGRNQAANNEAVSIVESEAENDKPHAEEEQTIELSSDESSAEEETGDRKKRLFEEIRSVQEVLPKVTFSEARNALKATAGDVKMAIFKLEVATDVYRLPSGFKKRARENAITLETIHAEGELPSGFSEVRGVLTSNRESHGHHQTAHKVCNPQDTGSKSSDDIWKGSFGSQTEALAPQTCPPYEKTATGKSQKRPSATKHYLRDIKVTFSEDLLGSKWGRKVFECLNGNERLLTDQFVTGKTRTPHAWEFSDGWATDPADQRSILVPYVFLVLTAKVYVEKLANGSIRQYAEDILQLYSGFVVEIFIPGASSHCKSPCNRQSDDRTFSINAVKESLVWLLVEYGFRSCLLPAGEELASNELLDKVEAIARAPFLKEDAYHDIMQDSDNRRITNGAALESGLAKLDQVYCNFLTRLPGLTPAKARAICKAFPTLKRLMDAFDSAGPEKAMGLLTNLAVTTDNSGSRRLGPNLAGQVYNLLCGSEPKLPVQ